jgi:hypothetical protein
LAARRMIDVRASRPRCLAGACPLERRVRLRRVAHEDVGFEGSLPERDEGGKFLVCAAATAAAAGPGVLFKRLRQQPASRARKATVEKGQTVRATAVGFLLGEKLWISNSRGRRQCGERGFRHKRLRLQRFDEEVRVEDAPLGVAHGPT